MLGLGYPIRLYRWVYRWVYPIQYRVFESVKCEEIVKKTFFPHLLNHFLDGGNSNHIAFPIIQTERKHSPEEIKHANVWRIHSANYLQ